MNGFTEDVTHLLLDDGPGITDVTLATQVADEINAGDITTMSQFLDAIEKRHQHVEFTTTFCQSRSLMPGDLND